MSELKPDKLHVTFGAGASPGGLSLPRRYTLTHSDRTGDLFLTIGADYDREQIAGFYTRLMRDEILAELQQEERDFLLHVYSHVSGGLVLGTAGWRYNILHHHMPMVIEALRHGDREMIQARPEIDRAEVLVHFQSSQSRYNRIEAWGFLQDYR